MSLEVRFNAFDRLHREYGAELRGAFEKVISSGRYVLGPELAAFERELAERIGVRHAVGVGNGLDALVLGLQAAGLRPGQKVATTPLTAFATTLAVARCGGVPVYIDVDEHGLLDLDALEARLTLERVPFVLPVHLYGQPLDLRRLTELCSRFGSILIEDVAQALGASSAGRFCGSAGKISAVSFYPTKNLGAIGDGGAVLTNDDGLAAYVRAARNYGESERSIHPLLGCNSRLDEVQAAILRALLPALDGFTERRRAAARTYMQRMSNPRVELPLRDRLDDSVWHLFPVLVREPARFMAHLKANGIESLRHYPVLCADQEALKDHPHESRGALPRARRWAASEVSLPCHPFLTAAELEHVGAAVNAYDDR